MSAPRSPAVDSVILIFELLKRIPRRRFTTSTHLLEQLQAADIAVTRRTLQRHLDVLVGHFPIECDTRSKPFGYRWAEGSVGFNLPLLSPPEALLLQLAKSELAALLPARTLRTLEPLLYSARQQLDVSASPSAERRWFKKTQRIPENQPLLPPKIAAGVFEAVSDALYQECKLFVSYRNVKGNLKQVTIQPLALVQQGVRSYLVCRFDGYDNERILALPRIHNAEIREPFTYPADFNLGRYIEQGNFGILRGPQVTVSFLIEKSLGQHLAESPLSADQQLVAEGEKLHVTATVADTELLHRWLRSWGDGMTELIITPKAETTT